MDENFVKYFSPYKYVCHGLLIEFFIEKPDLVYLRLVQIIYINLKYEGIYATSRMG